MATTPHIDPEQLKSGALKLRDTVTEQAEKGAVKAVDLTEQGLEWAAPRAQKAYDAAVDKATPLIHDAADRAQVAADKAKPYLEDIHGQVSEDYLPRVNKAASAVTEAVAADGALADRAKKAYEEGAKALATPTPRPTARKRHRVAKTLGWTTLGISAAGVGYLLWKRSQPIEDPWAEEYWADLETDAPVPDTAAEAVEDVKEAASDVKDAATEKAQDVKEAATEKAGQAKAATTRKAGQAKAAVSKKAGSTTSDQPAEG